VHPDSLFRIDIPKAVTTSFATNQGFLSISTTRVLLKFSTSNHVIWITNIGISYFSMIFSKFFQYRARHDFTSNCSKAFRIYTDFYFLSWLSKWFLSLKHYPLITNYFFCSLITFDGFPFKAPLMMFPAKSEAFLIVRPEGERTFGSYSGWPSKTSLADSFKGVFHRFNFLFAALLTPLLWQLNSQTGSKEIFIDNHNLF
jgi:hypothetical protein